ncbi:hypothetical protein [Streptomyces roseochromogenus]|uniref:Uncharacterized protein n=1 Tax=Streptomyces roseochromogenus subsp. oscitans DS 12.976 TaxID=1352936 RepID=V6K4A0_STRRC|nr:hypothetical protein [Streptomyces roseochromogenus]EST26962.1 hypothetical protein M878_26060 [Streptomyces roseochromogenus subsp. oscitans DS 12.976]
MSTNSSTRGILAATVHVLDPVERVPLVLEAGIEVTDPAIAEQITNPRCWQAETPGSGRTSTRKSKAAQ